MQPKENKIIKGIYFRSSTATKNRHQKSKRLEHGQVPTAYNEKFVFSLMFLFKVLMDRLTAVFFKVQSYDDLRLAPLQFGRLRLPAMA